MLVKHAISLLFLDLLVSRKVPGCNIIQIVRIVGAVILLGLFYAVVEFVLIVLKQFEGFLVLDFEHFELVSLLNSYVLVHRD